MELSRARERIEPDVKIPLEKDAINLLNNYKKALEIL